MRMALAGAAPESAPGELAAQRDFVEPFALVVAHAARQDMAFPRPRRGLEAGQLPQHLGDAARAFELVFLIDMLPAGEELQESAGADRLDFAAERVDV